MKREEEILRHHQSVISVARFFDLSNSRGQRNCQKHKMAKQIFLSSVLQFAAEEDPDGP